MHLPPFKPQVIQGIFSDVDAMAASPLGWNQQYDQIGRGRFEGRITQLVLGRLQIARLIWSPGVLQAGSAPKGTWVFGLPIAAERSLHVRRRPARSDELLVADSLDDIGFAATGRTDLVVVVFPVHMIRVWMEKRRTVSRDVDLPSPRWRVSPVEMNRRASALAELLQDIVAETGAFMSERTIARLESRIFDTVLDLIPSAEVIPPLHSRARVARAVLEVLRDGLEDTPTITELCDKVGCGERTLYLSCVEAFGRSPMALLLELRLNAARRALSRPNGHVTVTNVAADLGFTHFSRFAGAYFRQFAELPSTTLSRANGNPLS